MSIPDELRNICDHLRSGRFGQREVWERQLEQAAVDHERLTAEIKKLESIIVFLQEDLRGEDN